MEIKKVLNDGMHLEQQRAVLTFTHNGGFRKPKYIFVGKTKDGLEIAQPTKRECKAAIERNNRIYCK